MAEAPGLKELYEFGPFRVDAEKETLLRAGEAVALTPKTFQILMVLVRHSQEVVTKDDLLKTVWPDTFVEEANLSRNIFMLRKALGESPQDHALARSGDITQAEALADDIQKRFLEDTPARFSYLPTLKAIFALQRGDPANAIEELQSAIPYQTGIPRLLIGAMYPVYVRGEALLAEGRGADAANEFQRILDHRGVVGSDPVGALARLELGRAYRLSGNSAKAKAAYEVFFTLWQDADASVPVLMQARSEYAAIRD